MKKISTLILATVLGAGAASAQSVAFSENFNSDYTENFPNRYDLDHQAPIANFRDLFLDKDGVAQPWWHLRDASTSNDRFLGSHSAYNPAGKSNDWICSRAIEIPTEGFILNFDAQSYQIRYGERQSDLWLFITEEPFSKDNPPTVPTKVYEKVPYGQNASDIEGDFTHYSLSLDEYAGKTIYLNFANLNEDKDILTIDNIEVVRYDKASISSTAERYVLNEEYEVTVTIKGTSETPLENWTLTFNDGIAAEPQTVTGAKLSNGEELSYTFKGKLESDQNADYTATLSAPGEKEMITTGIVTRMGFLPYHRVLMEETTGLWCGNCPLGIYTIEHMVEDPLLNDKVIPVSIHITGGTDDLINLRYAAFVNIQMAPMFMLDRNGRTYTFNPNIDAKYDPSNKQSVAALVLSEQAKNVLADIDIKGEFVKEGEEITGIKCDVEVNPAVTLSGDYGIGIILLENNVGYPGWIQHNYYSGQAENIGTTMDGWTNVSDEVEGMRWNEVARGIFGARGFDDSLPAVMPYGRKQTFSTTIEIPDTYEEEVSPAIRPEYTCVIAYIWDRSTNSIVNSNIYAMTEKSLDRYTFKDFIRDSGVEDIELEEEAAAEAEYFNLQGVRVSNPSNGIFIVKKGSKTSKQIFR